MCSVVVSLSSFLSTDLDNVTDFEVREKTAIQLIAKMPVLAAIAYRTSVGLPIVPPSKKLSYVENFLNMMFSDPMDDKF